MDDQRRVEREDRTMSERIRIITQIIALILTTPLWVPVILLGLCVMLPIIIIMPFVMLIEYAFTGEWNW